MRFRQCREGRHAVVAGDFGVSDDGQYGGRITRAQRAESETLCNQLWETARPRGLELSLAKTLAGSQLLDLAALI